MCKRWKQLCSAHADTHRQLAVVICEATQRDWVQGWPTVRAPHASSVSVQALCRQMQEAKVRASPDVRFAVALFYRLAALQSPAPPM